MIAENQLAPNAPPLVPSKGATSLPFFDLVRTFAAWAVLAWHLADALQFNGLPIFSSGAFAVDIFMNVSGFLMFYNYSLRETKEPWDARTTWFAFWIRRFFRISPLYYTLLLGTFVFKDFLQIKEFTLGLYLTYLFPFFPHATGSMFPDWSLALEMQFYLFFPLLAWTLRRVGSGPFFAAMAIVGAVTQVFITYYDGVEPGLLGWIGQPMLLPLKIHIFTVGMIAAQVYLKGTEELRSKWFLVGFVAFALTCSQNYMWLMAFCYFCLYLSCLHPVTARIVEMLIRKTNRACSKVKLLLWAAELSYSVYLLHALFFLTIFFQFFPNLRSGGTMSGLEFLCWYVVTVIVVNAIAAVTFLLIEKPGINLGKILANRVGRRTNSTPAVAPQALKL